ncbi:hypothetical protein HPB51_021834 [Rhipicephalus microplus]|uniref:Glycine N-methyltransferase n=1 Tax=Rhipicephalus microplus TaxID=6941 RepID=A0A9J6E394_RHIMP|nr:hypothetical protein HPB51_021834 [Rhipicephalus microplus]
MNCAMKSSFRTQSNHIKDIQTSVLYVDRNPSMVILDYVMDVSSLESKFDCTDTDNFRLSYFPHRLKDFNELLEDVFGKEAHHEIYGDFKPLSKDYTPAFYIHILKKV